MMSNAASWAAEVIQQQAGGRTLILRRPNNLKPDTRTLSSAISAGNTALILKSTSRLTGRVVKGSQFTITGIPGTYTVLVDTEAPTSGLVPVTFTPAIPVGQSAPIGATVTFTANYAEISYPYLSRSVMTEDEKLIEGGTQVRLLPYVVSKPAPQQQDQINGTPILKVQVISGDGDHPAYYRCVIGDTPSI